MPFTIPLTSADIKIARAVAHHANRRTERVSEALTWGADEHVLCGAAALWWIYSRGQPRQQKAADHVLLTTLAATALPHVLKAIFNQRRPDRLTVIGHLHGIPFSGKPLDAFPSGHAIHVGAIASAAGGLPRRQRFAVWALGGGLLLTRIVLLAHWASDVAVGLAMGVLLERSLRKFTGFGQSVDLGKSNAQSKLTPRLHPRS
jgi:hypothetical protein